MLSKDSVSNLLFSIPDSLSKVLILEFIPSPPDSIRLNTTKGV